VIESVAWLLGCLGIAAFALLVQVAWAASRNAHRSVVGVALAVGLAATSWAWLLEPPADYQGSGHETTYLGVATAGAIPPGAAAETSVPAGLGIAFVVGRLTSPDDVPRTGRAPTGGAWILVALGRLALPLWILLVAVAMGPGSPRVGATLAVLAALTPTATGWSASCYWIVPGLALATGAVAAGFQGRRGTAALLGAAAVGLRPEALALALAGLLLPGRPLLPRSPSERTALGLALALFGVATFVAATPAPGLVVGDLRLWSAVLSWGIGSPLMVLSTLVPGAVFAVLAASAAGRARLDRAAVFGACSLLAGGLLLLPVDLGARHFLPLLTLTLFLGGSLVRAQPELRGVTAGTLALAALSWAAHGAYGQASLHERFGDPTGQRAADQGVIPAHIPPEVTDVQCGLALPIHWGGHMRTGDPGNKDQLRRFADKGLCVVVVAGPGERRFSPNSERFDRLVHLLDLEFVERVPIAPSEGGPWWIWRREGDPLHRAPLPE
jgi:hypothetical protein